MSVLALPAYVLGFYLHSSASVVLSRHSVDSLEEKKNSVLAEYHKGVVTERREFRRIYSYSTVTWSTKDPEEFCQNAVLYRLT